MLSRFLAYIEERSLFTANDKILLAVSGGMDSVVMSHLFYKSKFQFALAHCNFGLRGAESDEDELFVKKLAKKYKVPFYSDTFDTSAFAEKERISIQMAARLLRYQWFEKIVAEEKFTYVATAHHLNDTLETLLLNLVRGTGIAGLHGIPPKNNKTVRPLLFANKDDIYEYVVENQLSWREDSSNQSTKYQRNLIRHEVIPVLKNINPTIEGSIKQTVEKVEAVERIFVSEIERVKKTLCTKSGDIIYISIVGLQQETEPLIKLAELIKEYNFSYVHSQDIFQALEGEPGKQFESPTHTLVKDRKNLVITPKLLSKFISANLDAEQSEFDNELFELKIKSLPAQGYKISSSPTFAALDKKNLTFPIKLRKWKEGDWFCPLGMKSNKKKISDFMVDEKIPLNLKDRVWVITSNGSVIWVVGHRIDDRFKITDKTEEVLEIKVRFK